MLSQKYLCTLLDHDNQTILGFCLFGTCQQVPFCFKCYELSIDNSATVGHQGHLNFCVQFQSIASMLERYIKSLTQDDKDLEIMTKNLSEYQSRILKSFTHKNKELEITTKKIILKLQGFQKVLKGMIIVSTELYNELKKKNYVYIKNNIRILKKLFSKYGKNEIPTRIQRCFNKIKQDICKNIEIEKIQFSIQKCACIHFENGTKILQLNIRKETIQIREVRSGLTRFDKAIQMGNQMIEAIYYKAQVLNKLVEQYAGLDFIKLKQKNCQELIKFFKEAAEHYQKCYKVYPHAKTNFMSEAAILQYQKRVNKAIQVCENPSNLICLSKVEKQKQKNYLDSAIYLYEKYTIIMPDQFDAYKAKADALFENEEYDEALLCYETCLTNVENKKNPEAYKGKAKVLLKLGEYEQSHACFQIANKLKENDLETLIGIADALCAQGQWIDAIQYYYQIKTLKPDYLIANKRIADTLSAMAFYDESIKYYNQCIILQPDYLEAYVEKADAFMWGMDEEELQIKCLDTYIFLYPNDLNGYIEKADALFRLEQYQKSINCYDQFIQKNPNNFNVYNAKAQTLYRMKKYEESIEAFEKYLSSNSKDFEANKVKGKALFKLDKYNEAIKSFDKCVQILPEYYGGYKWKANSLFKMENEKQSLKWFKKSLKLQPDHYNLNERFADALLSASQYKQSIKQFKKCIELAPENEHPRECLADALSELGRFAESLECLNKLLEKSPNNINYLEKKANALFDLEQYELAIEFNKKCIELDPKFAYPYTAISYALFEQRNYVKSILWNDEQLQMKPHDIIFYGLKADSLKELNLQRQYEQCARLANYKMNGIQIE